MIKTQLRQHRLENHCSNSLQPHTGTPVHFGILLPFCTTTSRSSSVSRRAGKAPELWPKACVCSSTLQNSPATGSVLPGAGKSTWLGSDTSSPSPALPWPSPGTAAFQGKEKGSQQGCCQGTEATGAPHTGLSSQDQGNRGVVGRELKAQCHGRDTFH